MRKTLLGVVHLQPLLSASRSPLAFDEILARALQDAEALQVGGVDGVIIENFGDAPFHKGTLGDPVPPDVPAALAVVAREVRRTIGVPVGINCLRNDGHAALGAAAVAGAHWVRINVFTGAMVTDQGLIEGEAARLCAYRKLLGAKVEILADLLVKHAAPLAQIPLEIAARDLAERSGASGLIVSGSRTGEPVDAHELARTKAAVGGFPVWIGSGLTQENARSLWPLCDGAIVGTAFKRQGNVREPVDPARVRALSELLPRA